MPVPLAIKIRIAIVLLIAVAAFATVGWSVAQPLMPDSALMVIDHHQPLKLLGSLVALALIATIVAAVVSRPYGSEMAPLAAPAGLCVWVLMSGSSESLLLQNQAGADRVAMFHDMIMDSVIWAAVVMASYLLALMAGRRLEGQSTEGNTVGAEPSAQGGEEPVVGRASKPHETIPKKAHILGKRADHLLAYGLTCIIAIVLLQLLCRSSVVVVSGQRAGTVPRPGQIIFAVAAAFFVAAWVGHQLFHMPLGLLLLTPLTVAVAAYAYAMQNDSLGPLAAAAVPLVPPSVAFATVLPLQYIAVGSLAAIAGHWFSVRTFLLRLHVTHS